jgi:hypothetical protein
MFDSSAPFVHVTIKDNKYSNQCSTMGRLHDVMDVLRYKYYDTVTVHPLGDVSRDFDAAMTILTEVPTVGTLDLRELILPAHLIARVIEVVNERSFPTRVTMNQTHVIAFQFLAAAELMAHRTLSTIDFMYGARLLTDQEHFTELYTAVLNEKPKERNARFKSEFRAILKDSTSNVYVINNRRYERLSN